MCFRSFSQLYGYITCSEVSKSVQNLTECHRHSTMTIYDFYTDFFPPPPTLCSHYRVWIFLHHGPFGETSMWGIKIMWLQAKKPWCPCSEAIAPYPEFRTDSCYLIADWYASSISSLSCWVDSSVRSSWTGWTTFSYSHVFPSVAMESSQTKIHFQVRNHAFLGGKTKRCWFRVQVSFCWRSLKVFLGAWRHFSLFLDPTNDFN